MPTPAAQLPLFALERARRQRGRRRGPKVRVERLGFVPHKVRPPHAKEHPVHVSIKRTRLAPNLREERIQGAIVGQIAAAVARGIRVVHYSIQQNHLHLLVEAADAKRLARGMQLLFSRIALTVNRMVGRRGSLFRDRHHRHELRSPTETRNALVYVLFNAMKHALERGLSVATHEKLDPCSSAAWHDAWHEQARPPPALVAAQRARFTMRPVATPTTWLARHGWQRRRGPLRFDESPSFTRERSR